MSPQRNDALSPARNSWFFDGLTWDCMVCGLVRPDSKISVMHVAMRGMEEQFPGTRMNVRYCNDKSECIQGASNYTLDYSPSLPPARPKPGRISRVMEWFYDMLAPGQKR